MSEGAGIDIRTGEVVEPDNSPEQITEPMSFWKMAPSLAAIAVDSMGFGLVYPLMTSMFTGNTGAFGITSPALQHFYLGLGFLLYPLFMFFGATFMGDLSDNWGRKKVIMLCMGGITFSFFAMGLGVLTHSILILMFGRALSGLMAGSQPIAQAAIADKSTKADKARNMSIMTLALSVGIVAGPLIGGIFSDAKILSFFSFSTPFFLAALLALGAFLWVMFRFEETFEAGEPKTIHLLRPVHIFIDAFKHKQVRLLAIIFLCMQLGFSLYFQYILTDLRFSFAYTSWQLGLFNAFVGVSFAMALLTGIIPYLEKRFSLNGAAIISLMILAVVLVASAITTSQAMKWALALPVGLFDMVAYTLMLTLFSNSATKETQGWVMGISGAVMAVAWAVTGLFANLISTIGAHGLIFMGGMLAFVAALLMLVYGAVAAVK